MKVHLLLLSWPHALFNQLTKSIALQYDQLCKKKNFLLLIIRHSSHNHLPPKQIKVLPLYSTLAWGRIFSTGCLQWHLYLQHYASPNHLPLTSQHTCYPPSKRTQLHTVKIILQKTYPPMGSFHYTHFHCLSRWVSPKVTLIPQALD